MMGPIHTSKQIDFMAKQCVRTFHYVRILSIRRRSHHTEVNEGKEREREKRTIDNNGDN